jgi:hypothetical protein
MDPVSMPSCPDHALLNGLLQQSSHVPEAPRVVSVNRLVHDLATLIGTSSCPTQLVTEVPGELRCRLPEDALVGELCSTWLNSVAAMGDAQVR